MWGFLFLKCARGIQIVLERLNKKTVQKNYETQRVVKKSLKQI